jgi:RHS repeat-associated protein
LTVGGTTLTACPDASEIHFTGKERDPESGLDYFGARYYESAMARWLKADWSEGPATVPYASFGDPQSLNLYVYAGNNPLTGRDADGHDPWDLINPLVSYFSAHPAAAARTQNVISGIDRGVQKAQRVAAAHPRTVGAIKGGAKMIAGAATVGASVTTEVGTGGLASVPVMFGLMGGAGLFVQGFMDVMEAATNTDVSAGDKALNAVSNPAGLLTTAVTGNLDSGAKAAAIGDAAVTLGSAGDILEGSKVEVGLKVVALSAQSLSAGEQAVQEASHESNRPAPEIKPEN